MKKIKRRTVRQGRTTAVPVRKLSGGLHKKIAIIAAIILCCTVLVLLWFSGLVRVSMIEVEGLQRKTAAEVLEALDADVEGNIFLVSPERIREQLLQKMPVLESVRVEKYYFPNKLVISVTERLPVLAWHTGMAAYAVDKTGIVLGYAQEEGLLPVYAFGAYHPPEAEIVVDPAQPPVADQPPSEAGVPAIGAEQPVDPFAYEVLLEEGTRVAEPAFIEYLLALYSRLPESTGKQVVRIQQGESTDMTVILDDGLEVRFSTAYTIQSELDRLAQTLEDAAGENQAIKEYVDLRFEKVYFK
ncbi:MAG TPA: FtsQ-type POTRA domain-containing protein [bacterium]|nr:FtsQ-type POTRA domain-containing protein [bacterium]